jgi:hypothetical protein
MNSSITGIRFRRLLLSALLGLVCLAGPLAATSVVPPAFSDLVNGADYIVRVRVKSVVPEVRLREGRELIYSKVELEVLEVIAGTPPQPLILTMLGGQMGDRKVMIQGAPVFNVGNEDILFVRGNGRVFYPLYAMMHGQYPLLRDEKQAGRQYVNRSNLVPLLTTDEVAQPMAQGDMAERLRRMRDPSQALSPTDFAKAIRNVRRLRNEIPANQR